MYTKTFSDELIASAIKEANDNPVFRVVLDYTYEIPDYNDRDYAKIANQDINRRVLLPKSRQYMESEFMLSRVTHLSRSIEQRIGAGSNKKWENFVRIYNFFADELGYEKITATVAKKRVKKVTSKPIRIWDEKESTGVYYGHENMVYMSDGVYIHKDDCWW